MGHQIELARSPQRAIAGASSPQFAPAPSGRYVVTDVGTLTVATQVIETHYSVTDLAERLDVSRDWVLARINSGEIRAIEFGTGRAKYRIAASEAQRFIDSLPTTSAA